MITSNSWCQKRGINMGADQLKRNQSTVSRFEVTKSLCIVRLQSPNDWGLDSWTLNLLSADTLRSNAMTTWRYWDVEIDSCKIASRPSWSNSYSPSTDSRFLAVNTTYLSEQKKQKRDCNHEVILDLTLAWYVSKHLSEWRPWPSCSVHLCTRV